MWSFLGFANYYRRFVKHFAAIADFLTSLTRTKMTWQWGPYQRHTFQRLKKALCATPVLKFPDPNLPYTVVTGASGTAAGGVLMQDQGEGLQPLAFLSRRLKPTKQRYSAYEWELAVVAYCLQSWRHYLEGCPRGVTVVHCVRVSLTGTTVALSWACWSLVWGLVGTNTLTL